MWAISARESPQPFFEARIRRLQNAVVVWPPDEIDLSTIGSFRRGLIRAGEERCSIIIDMSQVSYIASIGVHELLTWAGRCAERRLQFVLTAPDKFVLKVLGIVDADGLIPISPSLDDALQLFDRQAVTVEGPPPETEEERCARVP